jgi:hypothetical protein
LGYRDWGRGEFETQWEYEGADGSIAIGRGVCIYMMKALERMAGEAAESEQRPG